MKDDKADVSWVTNVKSARDSYFTAVGNAETSFDNTLTGAMGSYYNTMLDGQIARSQSHFDASQTRYQALESAMNDYSQTSFDSAKSAAEKYRDAAIKEIKDNAESEKDVREKEKDHYAEKAGGHEQDWDDALENLAEADADKDAVMDTISLDLSGGTLDNFLGNSADASADRATAHNNLLGIAGAAKTTNTAVNSAKSSRETAARNAVNTAKTENKNIRKETDKETEKEHKNSENDGWNAYYTATVSAGTAYLTSYKQAENTFKTTSVQAEDAYSTTVLPAAMEFENEMCRLYGRFYDAVEQANLGFGVDATFYGNGATSTDVQVCFVAGTPVLLSDGTSKAIEEIEVGDEVFARPHDNPTGELVKCKVVRTFVNQKDTWSLTIRNLQTQECLVIRGTSEHPFYVQGKGWVSLGELREGDQLVSATDEMMLVISKEHHAEIVEVYNFEVENAHTYFVGKTPEQSVLVHNDCEYCGAKSTWYRPAHGFISGCPVKNQEVLAKRGTSLFTPQEVQGVVVEHREDRDMVAATKALGSVLPGGNQIINCNRSRYYFITKNTKSHEEYQITQISHKKSPEGNDQQIDQM